MSTAGGAEPRRRDGLYASQSARTERDSPDVAAPADRFTDHVSATGKRWQQRSTGSAPLEHPKLPALICRLLSQRGLSSPALAEAFLRGALVEEHDPALLPEIDAAVNRIAGAIQAGELICVFGDYDVDGVTGTAILVEGLTALGGRALPYLPDRFSEGYGLNAPALSAIKKHGAALVVSVDCGVGAADEVDFANEIGLDVIVVDHHTLPDHLPDAIAVVDPKIDDCLYPTIGLAACGLAYKLLTALAARLGDAGYDPASSLDLVALGTVCDMAPLVGENRFLVRRGLRLLAQSTRPGLQALAAVGGFDLRRVNAETLGFRIGPRINAAGRLDHAGVAYELLTTTDEQRALELAHELERLNAERRQQTKCAVELAETLLASDDGGSPLIVVGHPDISQGIVGLVAGRLVEAHHRPAIVYEQGADFCKWSARSIPQLDIIEALYAAGHLMTHVGGHRAAAGFTAPTENMPALTALLRTWVAERLTSEDLTPVIEHDGDLDLDAFGPAELKWLPYLEPYGQGNPEPLFVARDLRVVESRAVGDGTHLRLRLRSERATWPAIAFGLAHAAPGVGSRVDVLFALRTGERGRPDLHVRDLIQR